MSNLKETIATLEHHNEWRMGYEDLRMLPPAEITKALKHAIAVLKLADQFVALEKNEEGKNNEK